LPELPVSTLSLPLPAGDGNTLQFERFYVARKLEVDVAADGVEALAGILDDLIAGIADNKPVVAGRANV
jgi:hypothetical protein